LLKWKAIGLLFNGGSMTLDAIIGRNIQLNSKDSILQKALKRFKEAEGNIEFDRIEDLLAFKRDLLGNVWDELEEKKYNKQELIEYVEKFNKNCNCSGSFLYSDSVDLNVKNVENPDIQVFIQECVLCSKLNIYNQDIIKERMKHKIFEGIEAKLNTVLKI
jgi:hypothetical protein